MSYVMNEKSFSQKLDILYERYLSFCFIGGIFNSMMSFWRSNQFKLEKNVIMEAKFNLKKKKNETNIFAVIEHLPPIRLT